MVDFSKPPMLYWDIGAKISYLQRKVIIHSIIYYDLNDSCISDMEYDSLCRQLVKMQSQVDKDVLKETMYYYVMYDFDGTTGFDIIGRLNSIDKKYLTKIASFVLYKYGGGK